MKPTPEWQPADPAGLTLDVVRPIRDAIESRVLHLLGELNVPVAVTESP